MQDDLRGDLGSGPGRVGLLVWILLLFVGSLLVAAFLAPVVFNLLLWLGRSVRALEFLRDVEFERVCSRTVLLVLLVSVFPMLKISGIGGTLRSLGFPPVQDWSRRVWRGLLLGSISMLVVLLAGWWSGAYDLASDIGWGVAGRVVGYLVGAVIVGVIEEWFFRGVLFGILRAGMGFWGGAIVSSAVFSSIHFAKPVPASGVVYGHWYSGFSLMPYMFQDANAGPDHYFPVALTLFLMGMVLCAFYQKSGSLYFVIGLHAGWVWVMRVGVYFFERNVEHLRVLFGSTELVSKSYIALLVILTFFGVALLAPNRSGSRGTL